MLTLFNSHLHIEVKKFATFHPDGTGKMPHMMPARSAPPPPHQKPAGQQPMTEAIHARAKQYALRCRVKSFQNLQAL